MFSVPAEMLLADFDEKTSFADVIRKLEAKPSVELKTDPEPVAAAAIPTADDDTMEWARLGYIIIAGLVIALIAIAAGIINPKPLSIVAAAIGMTMVVAALWYGGRLEHAN